MRQTLQFGAARARTASYQVIDRPCALWRIDGYVTGAAGTVTFLQLFDTIVAPQVATVPKKSLMLQASNGFSYTFLLEDEQDFKTGIYMVLSTDERVYATDASHTVSGDMEITEVFPSITLSTSGVLTNDVSSLQPWNNSQGPKFLYRVQIQDNGSVFSPPCYLMLFATDTPVNGDFPIWQCTVNAADVLNFYFGDAGRSPQQQVAGVNKVGCYFWISSTPNFLTKDLANNIGLLVSYATT